MGYSIPA